MKSETLKPAATAGLVKRNLKDLRLVKSARLRHPSVTENDNGELEYSINYIVVGSGLSSKSITSKCTKEVFQKVYGKVKSEDSVPVGGYANSTGYSFLLFIDKNNGMVEAIGAMPTTLLGSRGGGMPSQVRDIKHLELVVQPSGSFEVPFDIKDDASVFRVPFKLTKNNFDKIVTAFANVGEISAGDSLAGFYVDSVVGNRVLVEV